jgi:hypothetical protein
MKTYTLTFLFLLISGCLSNPSKEDGFYTWVDERGQVRTVKTPSSKGKADAQTGSKNKTNSFDPGEFATEEQVEARLKDSKMFAWQENGQQRIVETSTSDDLDALLGSMVQLAANTTGSYSSFRKGEYVSWQNITGKEVSLEQLFSFNEELGRDFILIDLEGALSHSEVTLKSYIQRASISVPQMVFLSESFDRVSEDVIPFEYYFPESWHSYGYMSGSLNIPVSAQYLLIYTSTLTEALQLDGQVIKLTNLGKISFEFLDSN